jgi:hypothetical protein
MRGFRRLTATAGEPWIFFEIHLLPANARNRPSVVGLKPLNEEQVQQGGWLRQLVDSVSLG